MGTLYIMPLGFKIEYQIRFLLNKGGVGKQDGVVVLIPMRRGNVDKPDKALSDLKEYLTRAGVRDLAIVDVDTGDPIELLVKPLGEIARRVEYYDRVVFAITGGVRAFASTLPIIAVLLRSMFVGKDFRLFTVSEDLDDYVELTDFIKMLGPYMELSDTDIAVLNAIKALGAEAIVGNISDQVGKDASTVNRSIQRLRDYGLVEAVEARPRQYRLTSLGQLALRYYELLQSLRKKQ